MWLSFGSLSAILKGSAFNCLELPQFTRLGYLAEKRRAQPAFLLKCQVDQSLLTTAKPSQAEGVALQAPRVSLPG